jgi:hypothetical protein
VKRVRRELQSAKDEQARLDAAQKAALAPPAPDDQTAAMDNELQTAAKARLRDINQRIALATGGTAAQPAVVIPRGQGDRIDPELRNIGSDTKLSELVRRYEATRDVYQDLLKRRESARVAMELASEHRGVTMRIQEPAEFPVAATGLRLSHFCAAGFLLGIAVPIGVLFAIVRLDGRIRVASQIEALAKVPLLVAINGAPPDQATRTKFNKQRTLAVLMLVGVVVVYVTTFYLKTRTTS